MGETETSTTWESHHRFGRVVVGAALYVLDAGIEVVQSGGDVGKSARKSETVVGVLIPRFFLDDGPSDVSVVPRAEPP
jgi:hypothetical protein